MRRVVGGILKCTRALLGQARWFIARAINVVVPYQFLSNQLRDCSVKEGQFQCPTCTVAIIERIAAGKVTVKGVVHRIAKYEAAHKWDKTYPEMKAAVIKELASLGVKTNRNVRQIPIAMLEVSLQEFLSGQNYPWGEGKFRPYCDFVNAPIMETKNPDGFIDEGRYHMVLRRAAIIGRKVRSWILPAIIVGGIIWIGVGSVSYAIDTEHNIAVDQGKVQPCEFKCTCNLGYTRRGRLAYLLWDFPVEVK